MPSHHQQNKLILFLKVYVDLKKVSVNFLALLKTSLFSYFYRILLQFHNTAKDVPIIKMFY